MNRNVISFPSDQDRADNDELDRVCGLLEDMMEEHDALAAHVERLRSALNYSSEYLYDNHLNTIGHGSKAHMEMVSALEDTPTTSLARVKDKAQADLLSGLLTNHLEFAHPEAGPIVELMVRLEAALRQQAEGE